MESHDWVVLESRIGDDADGRAVMHLRLGCRRCQATIEVSREAFPCVGVRKYVFEGGGDDDQDGEQAGE